MRHLDSERRGAAAYSLGASFSGTNLERAGDYNQRVLLQAIRVNGPLTRSDLADMSGLTAPTIANITKRLLNLDLIVEAGRLHGARGQPAMRLAVNPDGSFSIGVNIDRDHITIVVLDLAGKVRARAAQEIAFPLPDAVGAFFNAHFDRLLEQTNAPRARLAGIGVAAPDDLGRVNLPQQPANFESWNSADLAALFSKAALPVYVENDAAAAAMGELQFGLGLQSPTFFYILISAALGGGVVIEGNYFRGASGRSGELGFLAVPAEQGGARSLQARVSLLALYEHLAAEGVPISSPDQLTALDAKGAALVDQWILQAARLLEEPLAAVNCLINPNAVFIGGRMPPALVDALAIQLNARLARRLGEIPSVAPVRRAAMAADAPAVGAAILPFNARLLPSQAALMKTLGASPG